MADFRSLSVHARMSESRFCMEVRNPNTRLRSTAQAYSGRESWIRTILKERGGRDDEEKLGSRFRVQQCNSMVRWIRVRAG